MSSKDSKQKESSRRSFLTGSGQAALLAMFAASKAHAGPENSAGGEREVRGDKYRKKLLACLGGEWPDHGPLDVKVESVVQKDGYRLERINYLVEPEERIAAYLLVPDGISKKSKAPAICVWHQHNGAWPIGKDEPAGLKLGPMHHTGVALAKEGYVVICPDAAGFGERNKRGGLDGRRLEHYLFAMYVVAGKCLAWKNISDMRRAVDVLCSREEVDKDRIGCYGHSMGSTHTWLVGPWEPRIKALVGNCCMPTYAAMERTNIIHCFPNYIPGWRQYGDIPDIVGMIAPKALHLNFGETDSGSPIEEVKSGMEIIERAYAAKKASSRFTYFIEAGAGHDLTEEMSKRMKAHFKKYLG
ncbi:MAG TPA: alpha/beta hydrolase family protein [Planctomycetota bacterium]|nr:alpha/beta hydrolase family protein [Planctomycetota bacterium]